MTFIKEDSITKLLNEISMDRDNLRFSEQGWKPICILSPKAKILIIGQAPGIVTQEKGEVFRDKSGDRLRSWLGVDEDMFYNSNLFAILPMDFYFPGHGKQGDLPPRKDFASKWHPRCLALMPNIQLTVLIGKYAQETYLPKPSSKRITDNIKNYKDYLPLFFPLIHPSPRNQIWISKNPFFIEEVLPQLKTIVAQIINT